MSPTALIPLIGLIGFVVLIILVARQGLRNRLNQLFIWYAILLAAWSFGSFMMRADLPVMDTYFWFNFMGVPPLFASVAFFHFVRVFLKKPAPRFWLFLGYGICVLFVIAFARGYVIDYAYLSEGTLYHELGIAAYAMAPVALGFGVAAIVNLVQAYRRTKDPFVRNRIAYPLAGILIVLVLSMTNYVPGLGRYPIDQAGNMVNALLLTYAILRYRLLDVSFVLRKGFVYSVLMIFILTVFLSSVLLLQMAFRDNTQYTLGVSAVITALILAFAFQPLYEFTRRRVDRWFYREGYDYRQSLLNASQRMSAMIDLNELSQWLVDNLKETMGASKASLLLLDPGIQRYFPRVIRGYDESSIDHIRLRSDNPVVKHLAGENGCLTPEEIDRLPQLRSLWEAERGQLKQLDAKVLVPLKVKGYLIGIVVLGPKRSEGAYTLDDLELLLTVAGQAAVAVENAQLFETSLLRAERLKESEAKYRELVEGINDVYIILRGDRIVFANNRCAEILDLPVEQIIGQRFFKFVAPESLELAMQLYERSIGGEKTSGEDLFELAILMGSGRQTPMEAVFREIVFEGQPAASGILRDITERKRAEKELRKRKDELEQRTNQLLALQKVTASIQSTLELREVLQHVSEAVVLNLGYDHSFIYIVDEKINVHRGMVFFTKRGDEFISDAERTMGQAVLGMGVPRVKGYNRVLDEALDGKTTVVHDLYEVAQPPLTREQCDAVQGLLGVKTIVNVPAFAKDRYVGSILVFSEKEEITEVELEPLRILGNQAGIAIEKATLYHQSEEKAQQMAVLSEVSRIIGSSLDIRDVYHAFTAEIKKIVDFDRASIALAEWDKLRFFAVASDEETELDDGATMPLEDTVTAWVMENKRTNIETDFTQEAQFPINGKHLERGLRSAIRVPIFSKGEVIGTFNLSSRHPNAYGEREEEILEQVAGQLGVAVENSRLFIKIREREMELSKAYQELKAAQDFMVESERLRALGEMAGGVAHDFNNILSIILGRTQLALEDTDDPKVRRALEIIEQTSLDASKTVRRLQDFARVRVDRDLETVDLNQIAESAMQMVESRRLERQQTGGVVIDIYAELGKVAPVEGNSAELNEALVNIFFNAMDAMPEGGKIAVKTESKNNWVLLSVSDTGMGMAEETKNKIFDPFFTTKGREGLGMGLSVTYGIVRRHGGSIRVESAMGKGTTFHIRLPVARDIEKRQLPTKPVPSVEEATILLVDDDPQVSEVLGLMLQQLGHHVTGFTSAKEALDAFEKGEYRLVITDLGMPDTSGREVAKAVKKVKPETPVLLITGWGVQLDPVELKREGVDGIIAKPFSKEVISTKLAELLSNIGGNLCGANGGLVRVKSEKILIVDDEFMAREMMQEILEREGYQAIAVGSGEEALNMAEEQDFDLLLADIKMPEMDGLELVQRFRELRPDTIPMLITGYASIETAQIAVREGVYDYIVKPFERSDLCAAVVKALRRKIVSDEESRLKELTGLYRVSQSIVTSPEQREVLDLIINAALHQTKSSGGAILLFDSSRQGVVIEAAVGAWEPATRLANVMLERGIKEWIAEMSDPAMFTDIEQHPLFDRVRPLYLERPLLAPTCNRVEMLLLPIKSEKEIFGVLNIYREGEAKLLSQSDLELLTILATQAGLSVTSRQHFAELEKSCLSALRSIASFVESRSHYTRGHMERVAQLSEQLGCRIGLSEEEVDTLKLAASLHDIGLIGISEAILNMPGELAPLEWDMVRLHPIIGDEILAPLRFLSEVRYIVRHHHERLDGRGYPDGLLGDEITPSVRVVSLCDSYDAMTSPRPWRQAFAKDEAIAMLKEEKGTKFDPEITDAFIDMLGEQC